MAQDQKPNLRSAEDCIWYVLATVAGEPLKTLNPATTLQRNREIWNRLMYERNRRGSFVERASGERSVLSPLSNTDRMEMNRALSARGFANCQIPDPDEPINFTNVNFPDDVSFDGFVFMGPARFDSARFAGPNSTFDNAVFSDTTSFAGAEFLGDFRCTATSFEGFTELSGAKFRRRASLNRCIFRDSSAFQQTQFADSARFDRSTFVGGANFAEALFEHEVHFDSADFQTSAVFRRAQFKSYAPRFFEAKLPEYTEWQEVNWPKPPNSADDCWDYIQRYQCLARLMNGLEKFDDQHLFVRMELRVRRATEPWNPVGWMNFAYELICGYGYGLKRAVAWWLGNIVVGAKLLCGSNIPALMEDKALPQATLNAFSDYPHALLASFGNAHGFLSLNDRFFKDVLEGKEWAWHAGVGGMQTIFGVIFLFFLLLTIRNLFRMR